MTSQPTGSPRHRASRLRPPHGMRGALLFAFMLIGLLGFGLVLAALAAVSLLPSWLVRSSGHRNPLGALSLLVAAVVVLGLAEAMRRTSARPAKGYLTLLVGPDEIGFERHGEVVDRVRRAEVGVVVIEEFGSAGVLAVTVRGPTGETVGRWDTGWLGKGTMSSWRVLGRHGWPRAIEKWGKLRRVSKDVPSWLGTSPP